MAGLFHTISAYDWRISTAMGRQQHTDMKLFFSLLALGAAKLTASDDLFFLQAIAAVESGNNPDALGANGERGAYQFTERTWKSTVDWPFSDAFSPLRSRIAALKHVQHLRKAMDTDSYWTIACGWKAGAFYNAKTETNEQMLARVEYANRVCAIFEESIK